MYVDNEELYTDAKTDVDCQDLQRLQNMTADQTYVVTNIELTRGVDYRAASGTRGIALLIMSPMSSERAVV